MSLAKVVIMTAIIAAVLAGILTYMANVLSISGDYVRYVIILVSVFIAMLITFRIARR